MKTLSLLFAILFFSPVFAQDYSCIISGSVNFYRTPHGAIKAAKFFKLKQSLGITEFASFYSLGKKPDSTKSKYCEYELTHSWLGKMAKTDTTGWNRFYNQDGDSINIKYNAVQGETFEMYSDSSGIRIFAKVSDIVLMDILGSNDSVKIYTLSSQHPNYKSISTRILVSKRHGMYEWVKPTNFPESLLDIQENKLQLVGYEWRNRRFGKTRLTYNEVYDFEVGDEFIYQENKIVPGGNYAHFRYVKLLEKDTTKKEFKTLEAIKYQREGKWKDTVLSATDYIESDRTVHSNYPDQAAYRDEFGVDGFLVEMFIQPNPNSRRFVRMTTPRLWYYNYDCIGQDSNGTFISFLGGTYTEGLGLTRLERYEGDHNTFVTTLIAWKKKTEQSSNWDLFVASSDESTKEFGSNKIKLFPNPSAGELKLYLTNNKLNHIRIYDSKGSLVFTDVTKKQIYLTDLNHLKNGVYNVDIRSNSYSKQFKWIKTP